MSGPHWRWQTDFPFSFLAEPIQTRFPGALTNCFADLLIHWSQRFEARWCSVM
jgi:hypothetical protein